MTTRREKIVDQHIKRSGTKELDRMITRSKKHYDVFECLHCDTEFKNEQGTVRWNMNRQIMDHLEQEHPEALERDPYPNENVFQEWADAIGASVDEPSVPGEPLLVRHGEMRYVYLHKSGCITIEAHRTLGGDREDETVRLEGEDRLRVRGRKSRNGYVSRDAFPVLRR